MCQQDLAHVFLNIEQLYIGTSLVVQGLSPVARAGYTASIPGPHARGD